ncbi:uracil-DNA glycosylase [Kineococcus sp. NUM-3379]
MTELQARRPGAICPDFDPAEAGVNARALFVLEAPGPMAHADHTARKPGTGFISVDNPDRTAQTMWEASRNAKLTRHEIAHWNIVPWYLGPASKKPTVAELRDGVAALHSLLPLLPQLEVIILCGRIAERGWDRYMVPLPRVHVVRVPHPSPLAMAQPGKRQALENGFVRVKELLEGATS